MKAAGFGSRVYGVGLMAFGAVCLKWGDFVGLGVPKALHHRTALAYAAAALTLAAGAAIASRKAVAWAAAAVTAYYLFFLVMYVNGRAVLRHPAIFGAYSDAAEQLSIAASGMILFAAVARIGRGSAAGLTRAAQVVFGVCALLFGGAHFVYMNMTAPLVPKWLPPSQLFWGYATGVCFVAAGLAILTRVQAKLAARLMTAMILVFAVLVHTPILLRGLSDSYNWSESALNLTIAGATWVVADSLTRGR
jgi:uncharacterized membrane protein YphA (DoxX/SURF4 family)